MLSSKPSNFVAHVDNFTLELLFFVHIFPHKKVYTVLYCIVLYWNYGARLRVLYTERKKVCRSVKIVTKNSRKCLLNAIAHICRSRLTNNKNNPKYDMSLSLRNSADSLWDIHLFFYMSLLFMLYYCILRKRIQAISVVTFCRQIRIILYV